MTIEEIQKLREAGHTSQQIEEIDQKIKDKAGFCAMVQMAACLQDYNVPFSEVVEAWRLAAVTRNTQ